MPQWQRRNKLISHPIMDVILLSCWHYQSFQSRFNIIIRIYMRPYRRQIAQSYHSSSPHLPFMPLSKESAEFHRVCHIFHQQQPMSTGDVPRCHARGSWSRKGRLVTSIGLPSVSHNQRTDVRGCVSVKVDCWSYLHFICKHILLAQLQIWQARSKYVISSMPTKSIRVMGMFPSHQLQGISFWLLGGMYVKFKVFTKNIQQGVTYYGFKLILSENWC